MFNEGIAMPDINLYEDVIIQLHADKQPYAYFKTLEFYHLINS